MENKFEFGESAEDTITGFKGIVTSRHFYLTGCTQYGLQPRVDKDGKKQQVEYFDETRLFKTNDVKITIDLKPDDANGCDDRERP